MREYRVQVLPDFTPMIDVMLALLVIYMLMIPLMAGETFAEPPLAVNFRVRAGWFDDHLLTIEPDGSYILDQHAVVAHDLASRVLAIYQDRSIDPILYLRADRRLDYVRVLDAMSIVRQNGVRVAGLIVEPPPHSQP